MKDSKVLMFCQSFESHHIRQYRHVLLIGTFHIIVPDEQLMMMTQWIVMTDMAKPEQQSPVTMRGRMRKRRG